MIQGFTVYSVYTAINMHTDPKTNYDFFKYGGKTRVSEDSFLKRKDKYFFDRAARKCKTYQDAVLLIWSAIFDAASTDKSKIYIRDVTDEPYKHFLSLMDSLTYKFSTFLLTYKTAHGKIDIEKLKQDYLETENRDLLFFICILSIITKGSLTKFLVEDEIDILGSLLVEKIATHSPFIEYCLTEHLSSQLDWKAALLNDLLSTK